MPGASARPFLPAAARQSIRSPSPQALIVQVRLCRRSPRGIVGIDTAEHIGTVCGFITRKIVGVIVNHCNRTSMTGPALPIQSTREPVKARRTLRQNAGDFAEPRRAS